MVVLLITAASSACVGILSQIQHSKCVHIKFCWGCWTCTRRIPTDDDESHPQPQPIELKNLEQRLQTTTKPDTVLKI